MYAFKCRSCGALEEPGNAGERRVPAACHVCGAGVSFDPQTGLKTYHEDNWIVLAELADKDLAPILEFHRLTKSDVVAHEPLPPPDPAPDREPGNIDRSAEDGLGQEDRPS